MGKLKLSANRIAEIYIHWHELHVNDYWQMKWMQSKILASKTKHNTFSRKSAQKMELKNKTK